MLKAADLPRLRRRLLAASQEGLRPDLSAERTPDSGDEAVRLHERDLAITISDASNRRRREAREALQRMDRGEYGFCLSCERPIPLKRLDARPEAPLCVACAERAEQTARAESGCRLLEVA